MSGVATLSKSRLEAKLRAVRAIRDSELELKALIRNALKHEIPVTVTVQDPGSGNWIPVNIADMQIVIDIRNMPSDPA